MFSIKFILPVRVINPPITMSVISRDGMNSTVLSDLSGSDRSRQDSSAKKVLLLLQVKDTEIRKKEADCVELRNAKYELAREVDQLKRSLSTIEEKYIQQVRTLSCNAATVEPLQAEVIFLKSEMAAITDEKIQVVAELKSRQRQHDHTLTDMQVIESANTSYESELRRLESGLDYQRSLNKNLSEQLSLKTEEIDDLRSQLNSAQTSSNQHTTDHFNKINRLQETVQKQDSQHEELTHNYNNLLRTKQQNESEINSLQEQLSIAKNAAVTASNSRKQLDDNISVLDSKNKTIETENTDLKQLLKSQKDEITSFASEVGDFKAQLVTLQVSLKAAEDENADLVVKNRMLDGKDYEIKKQNVDLKSFSEQIEILQTEIENLTNENSKLSKEIIRSHAKEKKLQLTHENTLCTVEVMKTEQQHFAAEAVHIDEYAHQILILEKQLSECINRFTQQELQLEIRQQDIIELHGELSDQKESREAVVLQFESDIQFYKSELQKSQEDNKVVKEQIVLQELNITSEKETCARFASELRDMELGHKNDVELASKMKKCIKKQKQEKIKLKSEADSLRHQLKEQSSKGVSDMHARQEVLSAITKGKSELTDSLKVHQQRIALLETEKQNLQIELKQSQEQASSDKKHSTSQSRKLTADIKSLTQCRDEAVIAVTDADAMIRSLQSQLQDTTQQKSNLLTTVQNLKRKIALEGNRSKSLSLQLENHTGQETTLQEKIKLETEAILKRVHKEDRQKRRVIEELRNDKVRLSEESKKLADDLKKLEIRNKRYLSKEASTNMIVSTLRDKDSRRIEATQVSDWETSLSDSMLVVFDFLSRTLLEVVSRISTHLRDSSSADNYESIIFPDRFEKKHLMDTSRLGSHYYPSLIRTMCAFRGGSKNCDQSVVRGCPSDLQTLFIDLISRRIALEAKYIALCNLT